MRIVGIGAAVRHTLVAIERDTARHAVVREVVYDGGVKLASKLISKLLPGPIPAPDLFYLNSKRVSTFADCRQRPVYQHDRSAVEKNEIWRISRAIAQTELKFDLELSIGDPAADLLLIEIPQLTQSQDPALLISSRIVGKKADTGWAVVKTEGADYIGSALYDSVHKLYGNRHIIIMSIGTVRRMNKSPLIGSLSWESAAEAVQDALTLKDALTRSFKNVSDKLPYAVIVSIMNDGAACFRFESAKPRLKLIYDPKSIEGEWVKFRLGRMAGYTQCIAAAVAAGTATEFSDSIENYVIAGLHGGRKLHEKGFNVRGTPHFPTDDIAKQIKTWIADKSDETFHTIPIPSEDEVNWSIAKQNFLPAAPHEVITWKDIQGNAFGIVKTGMQAYPSVPVVQFGKLTAVLRDDIEGLRAICGLMREYSGRDSNKRPLSIAVFGSPGAGKSFAVKSVAKSISDTRREFEILEFNLSQFSAPDQLYEALHQVRDSNLSGKMPLVFWDEFDCEFHGRFGWLRYFLAPMQDGKFTQGQTTHSVGNAVFIFAGGTSHDMQTFRDSAEEETAAKGRDFLSRLHGFLNIAGMDHGEILLAGVLIRRAILLRGLLKDYAPETESDGSGFDVDESVMTAFLCIPKFRYGARSMEAILTMSSLREKNRFEPSCLPPVDQIDLHVDSSEWLLLLQGYGKLLGSDARTSGPLVGW